MIVSQHLCEKYDIVCSIFQFCSPASLELMQPVNPVSYECILVVNPFAFVQ